MLYNTAQCYEKLGENDKALEKLDDRYKENINLVDEYNENAITASQNEQQWLSTNRELGDSLDNTAESTELTKNEIAELKKQYGITNQEIQELIETENESYYEKVILR